jgi:hypothetical protein
MRPHATRRTDWAQLGIGACALLLPPLALGAALYSMLAPDDGTTRPAATEAVLSDDGRQPARPADLLATSAVAPIAGPLPARSVAEGRSRLEQASPGAPVQVPAVPAVAINPPAYAEGAAAPPPTESPPAAAAPRRSIHRNAPRQPPQPQQDPLRTWLQQIGLLPPNR